MEDQEGVSSPAVPYDHSGDTAADAADTSTEAPESAAEGDEAGVGADAQNQSQDAQVAQNPFRPETTADEPADAVVAGVAENGQPVVATPGGVGETHVAVLRENLAQFASRVGLPVNAVREQNPDAVDADGNITADELVVRK